MSPLPPRLVPFARPGFTGAVPPDSRVNGFEVSPALTAFYRMTDGLDLSPLATEVLGFEAARQYAADLAYHPLSEVLGLWPLTESDDSNPYCLCLHPKLQGAVLRLSHDDTPHVTHTSLASFLAALESLVVEGVGHIDACRAEFPLGEGLMAAADALLSDVQGDLSDETLVVPLLSACSPEVITRCLSADNMWIREEAALLLGRHVHLPARDALTALSKAGTQQDHQAAKQSLSIVNRAFFAGRS